LLCMFMRLRLSPFAFSTAPRKHTQMPISEESYIEDLETAISARQNLNLPSSPLDVFFSLHGMAPLQKWPHAACSRKVVVLSCQCRPPAKRCQKVPCQYPNVVSNTTFS
jgi:hypothetical protein